MHINPKIQKLLHYTAEFLLFLVWLVLFFFPAYTTAGAFRLFFLFAIAFAMIYSFCRKEYFPQQQYYKAEKVVSVLLIAALFFRLLFFG